MKRIQSKLQTGLSRRRIAQTAQAVAAREVVDSAQAPVAFFNASARLGHLSLNAAFSLLASWGLRLEGLPVVYFTCRQGMTRCVLGTNPDDADQGPPCAQCVRQSERLYAHGQAHWFGFQENSALSDALEGLGVEALQEFDFESQPLGQIVLPSLRWALRRHNLRDDEGTRLLYREYILSAYSVGREFDHFLEKQRPQAVVLFNGIMYPEAMAKRAAEARDVRVITHEVGLRPFSAFFTDGEATAYPMEIPADFRLNEQQEAQLNAYLSERFQGRFSMAGIQFWPEMQALGGELLEKMEWFEKVVPVFTNVVFDTSQVHANTLFPHMFAWLDDVLKLIKANPKILFVIRAHPDEMRPGTRKQARESVQQWVRENRVESLDNVVFVESGEYLSSYALIARAHFVMVYNSSIGLEASILGKAVLNGGAARYTRYPTVYFPESRKACIRQAEDFLKAKEVAQPEAFVREARRVLYFQLYRTALPFEDYLEAHSRLGYVRLKSFPVEALEAKNSKAIAAILGGVVAGKPFLV